MKKSSDFLWFFRSARSCSAGFNYGKGLPFSSCLLGLLAFLLASQSKRIYTTGSLSSTECFLVIPDNSYRHILLQWILNILCCLLILVLFWLGRHPNPQHVPSGQRTLTFSLFGTSDFGSLDYPHLHCQDGLGSHFCLFYSLQPAPMSSVPARIILTKNISKGYERACIWILGFLCLVGCLVKKLLTLTRTLIMYTDHFCWKTYSSKINCSFWICFWSISLFTMCQIQFNNHHNILLFLSLY